MGNNTEIGMNTGRTVDLDGLSSAMHVIRSDTARRLRYGSGTADSRGAGGVLAARTRSMFAYRLLGRASSECGGRARRQLVSVCRTGAGGMRWRCRNPSDGRGADPVPELEQLALDPDVPQRGFSRAIRATNATTTSSIGGRRARLG
jgi:hypothetical protein